MVCMFMKGIGRSSGSVNNKAAQFLFGVHKNAMLHAISMICKIRLCLKCVFIGQMLNANSKMFGQKQVPK